MSEEILIDDGLIDTRVALLQDGRLVELVIAPAPAVGIAHGITGEGAPGSIFLGRVRRVLPELAAAFVDLGLPQAGFLPASEMRAAKGENGGGGGIPVHEGEAVLVQVSAEARDEKGVKLTMRLKLPGRHVVLAPFGRGAATARRLARAGERERLTAILDPLAGAQGLIARTNAEGVAAAALIEDVERLRALWLTIEARAQTASAPAGIWRDSDMIARALRDLARGGTDRIVTSTASGFAHARACLKAEAPDLVARLERFDGPGALFDKYDVENEIERALAPRLALPSGVEIAIGAAAALTAIDVDSAGAGAGREREAMALAANLEAAAEIARQIRLREIGGIIVIDFLRLADPAARMRVVETLRAALRADPAPTQVLAMSELGLVEMTRKRRHAPLAARLIEACPACAGAGRRENMALIVAALARRAEAEARARPGRPVQIRCAPEIAAGLEQGGLVAAMAARLGAAVTVTAEAGRARSGFEVSVP